MQWLTVRAERFALKLKLFAEPHDAIPPLKFNPLVLVVLGRKFPYANALLPQ
jgi:hypothetical protein